MEIITNKKVGVHLENETGMLSLTGLLENTMIFLYDSQGNLIGKHQYVFPSITLSVSKSDMYVLVMTHPNCEPEVRKIHFAKK